MRLDWKQRTEYPIRVCYPFSGGTIGGSHVSTIQLIKQLPKKKIEPLVVLHREGPLAKYLADQDISFQIAPQVTLAEPAALTTQIGAMARASFPLSRFLRTRNIDIVHTNDSRMHMTWGAAARLCGAHFVWHQRTPEDSRRLDFYTHLAQEILTISEYCRSKFPPTMSGRARVVSNPFDTNAFPPIRSSARSALLAELGAPSDAYIVGFVGNLIHQKRPIVFLEMAAHLQASLKNTVVFPMFGAPREGELAEKKITELNLSGSCFLLGTRFPIEPWLAGCNVLVAPAVDEGHGRTLVEAMLVGTPVVAADDGGHREIIDNRQVGILVKPDKANAFADVVEALLVNPDRCRKMASQARDYAFENFSSEQHVKTILKIYQSLVS